MRNPQGYATWFGDGTDGGDRERDTFTCFHCNRYVHVEPFQDAAELGALCKTCMKLICVGCADRADKAPPGRGCDPWEEQMTRMENRERFLRSAGIFEE